MDIVADRAFHPEIEEQVAEWLVGFVQPPDPLPLHDRFSFVVTAFGNQPTHFVFPPGKSDSPDGHVGFPAVKRILIELDAFPPRVAKDHGPQASVAHGQGLLPHAGGGRVPQPVSLRGQRQSQHAKYRR